MIADKDYGLTKDGKVVEQSDPASATVLVGKGCNLPDTEARRYGLLKNEETKAVESAPENKAVSHAPENKALKRGSTK